MGILRRDFLKYCVGSTAAFGLQVSPLGALEKVLAGEEDVIVVPSYPISSDVKTTLQQTVIPTTSPVLGPHATIKPNQLQDYSANLYGEWTSQGPEFGFLRPDMENPPNYTTSVRDPLAAILLTFFTMSDVHIADKESPARANYYGYQYPTPTIENPLTNQVQPEGNSSCYSGIMLYTTMVLDAAIQTINQLHQVTPFDFGIGLGDAADNTQYNELRWYIDVIDGKLITPSSGAHYGANAADYNYQRPFQAAGLDKSIKWYQAVGNHDQFWMGSAKVNSYIRKTLVGPNVLDIGPISLQPPYYLSPDWTEILGGRGFYMGVLDGTTPYGNVINVGSDSQPVSKIVPDAKRRSLSLSQWMNEFFNTTSKPVGHGFTPQMVAEGFVCYHFYPRAGVPIKVIVLDDTDKSGGANGALDTKRYNWLVKELENGQNAGQLMIICAHIPVHPFGQAQPSTVGEPYEYLPIWTQNPAVSENISEQQLLDTLHNYPNFVMWVCGHVHRNTITGQPSPSGTPGYGFWEVETPSLRDYPQEFRHFEIVRNTNDTISIFVYDVDPAVNPASLSDGLSSPAFVSRSYALGAQQIFGNPWQQGPGMDPQSCVYNAELIIQTSQLSQNLREAIARIEPAVSSFKINGKAPTTKTSTVTLNNTVAGTTPVQYMASESPDFSGASWLPYSTAPSFVLSQNKGVKTVYFKVQDGSGAQSAVVKGKIRKTGNS